MNKELYDDFKEWAAEINSLGCIMWNTKHDVLGHESAGAKGLYMSVDFDGNEVGRFDRATNEGYIFTK
jgi:hypothetical protein